MFPPVPLANYALLLAAQTMAAKVARYAPVVADSGRETWFEGAGVFPCLEPSDWSQLWDRHIKNESIGSPRVGNLNPAPAVDFRKDYVLAVFGGPGRGVVGYRAVSGYVLGTNAVLRLVPILDTSSSSAVALPSPWAFLVLPRTKATLKVELLTGGRWTPIAQVKPTLL